MRVFFFPGLCSDRESTASVALSSSPALLVPVQPRRLRRVDKETTSSSLTPILFPLSRCVSLSRAKP